MQTQAYTPDAELVNLTNNQLLGIYNGLKPAGILRAWKGRKAILVDRILHLRGVETYNAVSAENKKAAASVKVVTEKPKAEKKADNVKPKAKKTKTKKEPRARTIRDVAIELLCHVDFHEDKIKKPSDENRLDDPKAYTHRARSVGLPYDKIIDLIKAEFPEAKTTVACLRWYAVKIRVGELGYEDLLLPQRRPRVKQQKKG